MGAIGCAAQRLRRGACRRAEASNHGRSRAPGNRRVARFSATDEEGELCDLVQVPKSLPTTSCRPCYSTNPKHENVVSYGNRYGVLTGIREPVTFTCTCR